MAERRTVLVVDDEKAVRRFLKASIDPVLYKVIESEDGASGIRACATENPDVVVLDLGLPDMDGVEVTREIRSWSKVPILVLSARGREQDKIDALDAGADDYLTKPFGVGELLARIRVALRHSERLSSPEPIIEAFGVRIDLASHQVTKSGREIHFTPNEYKLLAELARNAGKVVTHRKLLETVWGPAYVDETHYLRVYTGQLRQKLEDDPTRPKMITNEPGVGYRLRLE